MREPKRSTCETTDDTKALFKAQGFLACLKEFEDNFETYAVSQAQKARKELEARETL